METKNHFEQLSKIDVSKHVKKKGKFSYLSWAFAVMELKKVCPNATWEVKEYGENQQPYIKTDAGCFVKVSVTVNDLTLSQIHPVLDNMNKSIDNPNSFQINTSIQRALAKTIALHGLGITIYAGEDLPENGEKTTSTYPPKQPMETSGKPPTASTVSEEPPLRLLPWDRCQVSGCGGKMIPSKPEYGGGWFCSNNKIKNCKYKLNADKSVKASKKRQPLFDDDVPQ